MVELLTRSGFEDIRLFGGISMDEFSAGESKDLVVLARKGEREPGRIPLVIPRKNIEGGRMAKNYVSNKDESARLFKSDFWSFFTHVHPTVPLIVYVR